MDPSEYLRQTSVENERGYSFIRTLPYELYTYTKKSSLRRTELPPALGPIRSSWKIITEREIIIVVVDVVDDKIDRVLRFPGKKWVVGCRLGKYAKCRKERKI